MRPNFEPDVRRPTRIGVDLYWLPLGAGGRSVRLNGRIFEAVVARLEKREPNDLYHSALKVRVPEGEFVIEMAPIPDGNGALRGVVAEGAVGSWWARFLRVFRYENRRWHDGVIPDVDEAVDSPQRLTDDLLLAQRVFELVPEAPTPVWGRDELQTGEMWNSNSLIAWLIARSGLGVDAVHPPPHGRAPGWRAGLVAARRDATPRAQPGATRGRSSVGTLATRFLRRLRSHDGAERDGRSRASADRRPRRSPTPSTTELFNARRTRYLRRFPALAAAYP
jgi:hypothetical protein